MAGATKLKTLKSTHPRLDLGYVEILRALYKGGRELLQNDRVMTHCFPRHTLENDDSYKERRARAFYDNDFALVINKITAGLAQDPIVCNDGGASKGVKDAQKVDDYWSDLFKDARPPMDSGPAKSFDEVVREVITEGLVCGWGWMLCDLPRPEVDELGSPIAQTALDQERMKADHAYPVPYRADSVMNWQEKNGGLRWLRTFSADMPADEPEDDREWTVNTWKVWTVDTITTYELVLNADGKDKNGHEWKDDDLVPPTSEIRHTFGAVPWIRFDCSAPNEPTMHVGDMIESRCRTLFNEACGETFQRYAHMFQQLYEFLGPEMDRGPDSPISEAQENPNRASRSMRFRAPGVVQVRGQDDDARFISPDMSGAAVNRQALSEGREAIPRVTGQLALSSDTSGAMIKRSGESKAQDKIAEEIVLGAVGKKGLAFANGVKEMLARGRGKDPKTAPALKGYEHFDTEDASVRVDEAVALVAAPVKSATFQVEHQMMLAKAVLGDTLSSETAKKIRDELESTITQESINQSNMPPVPPGHQLDDSGKPVPLPPKTPEDNRVPFPNKAGEK